MDLSVVDKMELAVGTSGHNKFKTFNRANIKGESDYALTPLFYVFITAPEMNISSENLENSPYLKQLEKEFPILVEYLRYSTSDKPGTKKFINILTNECSGFSPPDLSSQTIIVGETWTKLKQVYLGEDNDSRSAGSFSLSFSEKPGIPITKLIKAWYEYAQAVRRGLLIPSSKARTTHCIEYQASMYYFVLSPDGQTIEFWSKYTGIMPTGVPYSSFEGSKRDKDRVKVNVPFSYTYKEELEPEILSDFNKVVDGKASEQTVASLLSSAYGSISGFFSSVSNYLRPSSAQAYGYDIPLLPTALRTSNWNEEAVGCSFVKVYKDYPNRQKDQKFKYVLYFGNDNYKASTGTDNNSSSNGTTSVLNTSTSTVTQ
jgi:hypothetical protein